MLRCKCRIDPLKICENACFALQEKRNKCDGSFALEAVMFDVKGIGAHMWILLGTLRGLLGC